MKIGDIDKNLKVDNNLDLPDLKWLTPLDEPISLHGIHCFDEELGFLRMPKDIAKATSDGVYWLFKHPAGGRIRFRTNSKHIAAKVYFNPMAPLATGTPCAQFAFDLYTTENNVAKYRCSSKPGIKDDRDGLKSACSIFCHLYTSFQKAARGRSLAACFTSSAASRPFSCAHEKAVTPRQSRRRKQ